MRLMQSCKFWALAAMGIGLSGCPEVRDRATGPVVQIVLISSQENTLFELKEHEGGNWTRVGTGKIVTTALNPRRSYEIAATPEGYMRKTHVLATPVRELRFTFELGDMIPRDPHTFFELDVRAVTVADGRTAATAHRRCNEVAELRDCVAHCAQKLVDSGMKGTLAVAPFERTGALVSGNYAESASTMMITALGETTGVTVYERRRLDQLLAEHDLTYAEIVRNPNRLLKLGSIEYLIVGTLSTMQGVER